MKKIFLLLLLLIPILHTSAQDLTGIWRGTFYSTKLENMFGSDNKYEVQIDNAGRACKGVTYSYQNTRFYGKASLIGMWSPSSKNIVFKEDKLLEYKIQGDDGGVYMFTCYLSYRKESNKEILEGDYTSVHYKTGKDGGSGKIYLEKVPVSDFKKEDFIIKKEKKEQKEQQQKQQLPPPVKPKKENIVKKTPPVIKKTPPVTPPKKTTPPPSLPPKKEDPPQDVVKNDPIIKKPEIIKPAELPKVLTERKNELVKTIFTPGPEISIELYDNGEIDGDIISVFQNGRLIASHQTLSTTPITLKVKIDENNPDQEIVMVAENLGTIPPNTALMIVKSGGNRYDLRISSSEQKNAVVRFKYQK